MSKSKYVITITRQFGSLGRPIAKKMSELLGIEFYDRDLVDQAAEKLKLPKSVVDEEEESAWTLDSFNITMCYNRREAVANTPPLSEDFCK